MAAVAFRSTPRAKTDSLIRSGHEPARSFVSFPARCSGAEMQGELMELQLVAKAIVVALLALALAWALWFALKDVRWVYGVSDDYAKFRLRNINRISNPNTALGYLEDLNTFVSERIDATRARSARLVLLGFAIPGFILLLWISSHSWLFPGECPLQPGSCEPTLSNALWFVGWNYFVGLPSELLEVFAFAAAPVETNSSNWLLRLLATFVRYDAGAHVLALLYFELRVWQFRRANREEREKAESIAHSLATASSPDERQPVLPQSGVGPLQRAA